MNNRTRIKMNFQTKFISFVIMGATFMIANSCAGTEDDIISDQVMCFESRSGTPDDTYRIMVYDANFLYYKSGTYITSVYNGKTILIPWVIDAEGRKSEESTPAENAAAGVDGYATIMSLVCISPAIKDDGGSLKFCPTRESLYAGEAERVQMGQYGLTKLNNPLQDRRSLLSFKFYKVADSNEAIMVKNLQIDGAGADGDIITYYPAQKQVVAGSDPMNLDLENGNDETIELQDNSRWKLIYQSNKKYVASGLYCTKADIKEDYPDANIANYKDGDYLYSSFMLKQGDRDEVTIRKPVTYSQHELKAMNEYVFNIYIKSEMIRVILEIYSYDENIRDWENAEKETQKIDNSNVIALDLGQWKIGKYGVGDWTSPDEDLTQNISNDND